VAESTNTVALQRNTCHTQNFIMCSGYKEYFRKKYTSAYSGLQTELRSLNEHRILLSQYYGI
jgi:hypothetical protein